jgi:diacylglycerol kinase (ATP)
VATLAVFAAGFSFRLRGLEWCCVILAIGLVWVAEALNTAIETLTDLASPEMHPLAGRAKDIAAGAVLMASIIAVAVGAVLFGPRFWDMLPGK